MVGRAVGVIRGGRYMLESRFDEGGEEWRGRMKADRLGRWESSEMVGLQCEASSLSESPDAEDVCFADLTFLGRGRGADCEATSDAARRSLSSWCFRRDSKGRTPFSR